MRIVCMCVLFQSIYCKLIYLCYWCFTAHSRIFHFNTQQQSALWWQETREWEKKNYHPLMGRWKTRCTGEEETCLSWTWIHSQKRSPHWLEASVSLRYVGVLIQTPAEGSQSILIFSLYISVLLCMTSSVEHVYTWACEIKGFMLDICKYL